METSLKKQPITILRIEDSDHVNPLIHLERLRETTLHTINMNRPPIFFIIQKPEIETS